MTAKSKRHPRAALLLVLSSVLVWVNAGAYERDKSDVVTLKNGDHFSGDIVSLEYGMLTLSTDKAGTVYIEWRAVRSIVSKFAFAVERRGGAKFYGVLATSADGSILMVGAGDAVEKIPIDDVERVSRYSRSFWNRINGNVSAGFSYTKAGHTSVGSVNLSAYYRSTAIESSLNFGANTTSTESGESTLRAQLTGLVTFVRQSRNFWGLLGALERDQELGIDARLTGGAVVGRRFVQLSYTELTGVAGLVVTQESITNAGENTSLEGILGAFWRVFKFTDPKTSLTLGVALFPSLTESNRFRASSNLSLTHKPFSGDLTVGVTGYFSADSHPPDPAAQKTDYGLTFNLGYAFGD